MAKIVNTVTVQTTEGPVEVTKTSTHRTYVAATVAQREDGTQQILSWHLTETAAIKYSRSNEAQRIARHGGQTNTEVIVLPVVVRDSKSTKVPTVEDVVTSEDFVPQTEAEEAAQEATAGELATECKCHCGQPVGKGKNYRPGHDARHAGNIARLISQGRTEGWPADQVNSLVRALPTNALQLKALAMAHRLDAKAAAKAAKAAK